MVVGLSTASAGKLEDIKQRGTLVVGVKDSQPPFGYVDENTKQIVGFEPDLCAAIASRLGVKLETKPVTSATRIPCWNRGAIDLIAATMTHKIEREEKIDFSITYFPAAQKLLVKGFRHQVRGRSGWQESRFRQGFHLRAERKEGPACL